MVLFFHFFLKINIMKYIILLAIASLLTMNFKFSMAKKSISGIVKDKDSGEGMIGAEILESGTKNAAYTDIDGKFSLQVEDETHDLVVSYVGYKSFTVKLEKGKLFYEIELPSSDQNLNEIVITAYKAPLIEIDNGTQGSTIAAPGMTSIALLGKATGATNANKKYKAISEMKDKEANDNYDDENTESYATFQDNPYINTSDENTTTMSIDVDRAAYANIRRFLSSNQLPPKGAVRMEEMINYFDYSWPAPKETHNTPFLIHHMISDCPWNKNNKVLTIALKAKEMNRSNIPPSNLVFLIDVSGSMSDQNKLPLLKESFKLLSRQLTSKDKVSIVVYAGAAGTIIDGINGNDKTTIYESLDRLEAGGSTAGADGIVQAYNLARKNYIQDGNNRVILATDGDFNVGLSSDEALVKLIEKERRSNVFLSVLGFGMGNYQDNKMQQLADKGNGNHFYIDNLDEAKKSLVKEFGGSLFTVAKDVKIQIEFNKNAVSSYRALGYENRQLANEDFDDDAKDAGEIGAGHTVTVMYEIVPTNNLLMADLAKIKYRYKPMDSNASIKNEITISGRQYGFVNDNVKWALSIAEFGLLLRNSPYKSDANYDQLIEQTKVLVGNDIHKKECLELMQSARQEANSALARGNRF